MAINYNVTAVKGDTIRWSNFFYDVDGSTFDFRGSTIYMQVRLNGRSTNDTVASYTKYIDPVANLNQPIGLTGGIISNNFGTAYFCLGSTYSNELSTSYPYEYSVKVQRNSDLSELTILNGNIFVTPNTTNYIKYSGATYSEQKDFILLFDSYPGGNYWADVQQYSAGNSFNGEYYKLNSSFYEYGTAPSGYSTTGQNSGWKRKIPSSYYEYKKLPKPVTFVNLGTYILYPNVFFSSAVTNSLENSVPLPSGYTQGYYYPNAAYPGFVLTKSNISGLTSSSPNAYAPNGTTDYINFDNTGRGVTTINLNGLTALYYIGLTGPAPANGEEIVGFNSTTAWPQRNQASLIPVHDIVGIIVYIVSTVRAFYKNNPEYPQANFVSSNNVDHYVALSFGYAAVISNLVDALDLYVGTAPGIINSERTISGYNNLFVNRYDAISGTNEINRILKYLKTLNDGSTRNVEVKNKVIDVIKTTVLPNYNSGDKYSESEFVELENILDNIEKIKFSFYNTVIGPIHPAYLNTCNAYGRAPYLDVYSAIGSGVTCGSSTIDGFRFYSQTYYTNNNITYPFFTYDSSAVIPVYTVQGITLGLNPEVSVTINPYKLRTGQQNFNTYANILNVKFARSFKLANNTNGLLKYVDWIYFLAEDFEVYSNDDERAAWNYFFGEYVKYVRNYYRDITVPIISMETKQSVISSGDTENLASNGFVFIEPSLNFRRTIKPIIDAGLDGVGTYASYDAYMRTHLQLLENMAYTYSLNGTSNYSTGTRFSANTETAQYFGRSVNVGTYKAPPSCDIKKYITGNADVNGAVASVNPSAGLTYSQLFSVGDTATVDWSPHFPSFRGLTFNGYIQTLIGNCYQNINKGSGIYQNWYSRKEEVQKIIDINTDWAKKYYENALLYKYGATGN